MQKLAYLTLLKGRLAALRPLTINQLVLSLFISPLFDEKKTIEALYMIIWLTFSRVTDTCSVLH